MTNNQKVDRKRMLWCMEYLVRSCNDESLIDLWLMAGIPDGDVSLSKPYTEIPDELTEDKEQINEYMDLFLKIMKRAQTEETGLLVF